MNSFDSKSGALYELAGIVAQRTAPTEVAAQRWRELLDLAIEHGMAPMLGWALQQSGFAIPDVALNGKLNAISQRALFRSVTLRTAQRNWQEAFNQADIPIIWLKGIVLARSVYPRPELRPMSDLDLLLPVALRQKALVVATKLGYEEHEYDVLRDNHDLSYHYRLRSGYRNPVVVELHWRLLDSGSQNSLLPPERLTWFQQPGQLVSSGGFTAFRPEAQLLYLCAHAILQHGTHSVTLLRIFDLHLLIRSSALDWRIVVEQARLLHWAPAVERALLLTQQFFATELPDQLIAELGAAAASKEGAKTTFQIDTKSDVDMLWHRYRRFSFARRLSLTRAILLPPPDYMRRRYQISMGPIWPSYLRRWLSLSRKLARWLGARRAGK